MKNTETVKETKTVAYLKIAQASIGLLIAGFQLKSAVEALKTLDK